MTKNLESCNSFFGEFSVPMMWLFVDIFSPVFAREWDVFVESGLPIPPSSDSTSVRSFQIKKQPESCFFQAVSSDCYPHHKLFPPFQLPPVAWRMMNRGPRLGRMTECFFFSHSGQSAAQNRPEKENKKISKKGLHFLLESCIISMLPLRHLLM